MKKTLLGIGTTIMAIIAALIGIMVNSIVVYFTYNFFASMFGLPQFGYLVIVGALYSLSVICSSIFPKKG